MDLSTMSASIALFRQPTVIAKPLHHNHICEGSFFRDYTIKNVVVSQVKSGLNA